MSVFDWGTKGARGMHMALVLGKYYGVIALSYDGIMLTFRRRGLSGFVTEGKRLGLMIG